MGIHVALYHKTEYTYDRPVGHGPHVIRLRPAPDCRTNILSYSQRVTGGEHFTNWQQDPFSNWNARLVFSEPMQKLCVEVELVAEMAIYNPFDFFLEESSFHFPFAYEAALKQDLMAFLEPVPLTPKLAACITSLKRDILGHAETLAQAPTSGSLRQIDLQHGGGSLPAPGSAIEPVAKSPLAGTETEPLRTVDFLVAVNRRLQQDIKYLIRLEPGVQTPEETLT